MKKHTQIQEILDRLQIANNDLKTIIEIGGLRYHPVLEKHIENSVLESEKIIKNYKKQIK